MDNSKELIRKFHNKYEWDVCFGAMAILNLNYIKKIFDNTNYFKILLSEIKCRNDRMCFERIIALLLTATEKTKTVNGDIFLDHNPNTTFFQYMNNHEDKNKNMYKVWTGR